MTSSSPALRVRVNHIDHILVEPGPLDNSSQHLVPIIRVYGISSIGKKTCVHIHQVYPYFYIEYTGKVDPESVSSYVAEITRSLDCAIALSYKRNPLSPKSRFVRAVLLVKGVHFYGFHSSYAPFLKIHMIDSSYLTRAVTLLKSGVVMSKKFNVFESHISFYLQFMCDFNLYGCGWLDLGEVWRRGEDYFPDEESEQRVLDYENTPAVQALFKSSPHPTQSRMELEVDVVAFHVLNRHALSARKIHHKLSIPGPKLPTDPLVLSVRELWEDERRRRVAKGLDPSPELPADPSENSQTRWWDEIKRRIEAERGQEDPPQDNDWERWVPTTFESLDGLWEGGYRAWKPELTGDEPSDGPEPTFNDQSFNPYDSSSINGRRAGEPSQMLRSNVDETLLSSQQLNRLIDEESGRVDFQNQDLGFDENLEYEDGLLDEDVVDTVRNGSIPGPTSPAIPSTILQKITPDPEGSGSGAGTQWRTPIRRAPGSRKFPRTPPKFSISEEDRKPLGDVKTALDSMSTPTKETQAANQGPTEDPEENPFYVPTSTVVENDQLRSVKKRKTDRPLNVTFAPSPPSYPRHICFAEVTQIKRDTTNTHSRLTHCTSTPANHKLYEYAWKPPSVQELVATTDDHSIPNKIYQEVYCSKEADAPEHAKEYAGILFRIHGGTGLSALEEWGGEDKFPIPGPLERKKGPLRLPRIFGIDGWEYNRCPPSHREIRNWLVENPIQTETGKRKVTWTSQIEGPTQTWSSSGFGQTPGKKAKAPTREQQFMSILSLEVFVATRDDRFPDPNVDEIVAVFYAYQESSDDDDTEDVYQSRVVAVHNDRTDPKRLRDHPIETVNTELELLNRVTDIIVEFDPDILAGWETQSASWGYCDARGKTHGYDFPELISRAPGKRQSSTTIDNWDVTRTSTFKVIGRYVLDVWRIMRSEHSLEIYTFENTVFHVLRKRIPRYSHETLTRWYRQGDPAHTSRMVKYMVGKTVMVLRLLHVSETITKTAEFARVFGVDWFSVISRGSQFKVESFMFRIAKPESLVLLSPSKDDVGRQNAAECIPLIMEPKSDFYNSPLLVLDFQSLYPSIMIAYNYCYSTCLGRVVDFKGQNKLGVTDLARVPGLLGTMENHINVAPNGMIYAKPHVRRGLLGRMLKELLDTRVMVRHAMKGVKSDKALRRVLDARQLSLKYICNVTYGYTSATFSGRMPAVEIADSIVQSGRETLEKAIGVIETTQKWGAKVVYGDTDSLFIYLPGKTKDQAFRIGYDIANTITVMNPSPIKLKFEKVYLPCVLLAKKRYVGFKYETPDETVPIFDAKGIETVRRDGVLAQRKMTETCIKILFRTQDLSKVKQYCYSSWEKILDNRASIQDFVFAKEVRLGTYSDKGAPPPGAMVAARRRAVDPNDEPQYGDRIAYVITVGETDTRLADRAVPPEDMFQRQIDGVYYITHVLIPPLERVFNLVGADVRGWYDEMPKSFRVEQEDMHSSSPRKRKEVVDGESCRCLVCHSITAEELCPRCLWDPYKAILSLSNRVKKLERRLLDTHRVCSSCTGAAMSEQIECTSTDCPWLYSRKKAEGKVDQVARLQELIKELELSASLEESHTPSLSPEPEEGYTRESNTETASWPDERL
ncbi:hypothetical protein BDM02DRAFT_3153972 [Thelephora ganbajun]|uniref:Uncharacterized protein n=1 Tax=Thelephora ganbajun TaxID=370292 RepID=A0ACB6ZQV0_THEGA|nr:hypothetical protein BDM02DRAFT_3153972 [Thelephora ganbajun]